MKKIIRTHNFAFCLISFFALLFFVGGIFLSVMLIDGENDILYVLLSFFLCFLCLVFAIHYGSMYISVSGNIIEWKKEKYVNADSCSFFKKILFSINGTKFVSTLVKESFNIDEIQDYGLFEDFDKIEISEKMPWYQIKNQILVFRLKDENIFYINVKWFSKRQIRKILSEVKKASKIMPKEICAKVLKIRQS